MGRVERDRVLQLGARRADEPLRRLPRRRGRDHRAGPGRRPAPDRGAPRHPRPRLAADVPASARADDVLFPVLGLVLGRRAGSAVAAIDGLPPGQSEDRLKAMARPRPPPDRWRCSTWSAPPRRRRRWTRRLQGKSPGRRGGDARRAGRGARRADDRVRGERLAGVSLGTPHASVAELERYAALLDGDRRIPGVECLVSTGRDVLAPADRAPGRAAARGRRRAPRRHVQLHRADPAQRRRSGHDRLGQVGLLRRRATSVPRSSSARPRECIASAVAGRVVRDDGCGGRHDRRRSARSCSTSR